MHVSPGHFSESAHAFYSLPLLCRSYTAELTLPDGHVGDAAAEDLSLSLSRSHTVASQPK
jgi:hypothetical protein